MEEKTSNLSYSYSQCSTTAAAAAASSNVLFHFDLFGFLPFSNTIYTNHMKIPTMLCAVCSRPSDTTKALKINWAHAIVDIKEIPRERAGVRALAHTTHVFNRSYDGSIFHLLSVSVGLVSTADVCSFLPFCLEVFSLSLSPSFHRITSRARQALGVTLDFCV